MSHLVSPHGGTLVDRIAKDPDALAGRASQLVSVTLDARELAELELIAIGAASPLTGFVGRGDYEAILAHARLANGVAWPLPFTLAIGPDVQASPGGELALRDSAGRLWGVLAIGDVYTRDTERELDAIWGTRDPSHPGVAYTLARPRRLVGGSVDVLPLPERPLHEYRLGPREVRAELAKPLAALPVLHHDGPRASLLRAIVSKNYGIEQREPPGGFILWFTGMSGAGKSTLSNALAAKLHGERRLEILDGDEVREHLSKGLGFTKADRDVNVHRIGFVARTLAAHGVAVVTAAISPYADTRGQVRALAEARGIPFVEVFVNAPLDALVARDVKGLYKKALAGEVEHFTGVSDPYEPPTAPDVEIRSDRETIDDSVGKILTVLRARGLLAPLPPLSGSNGHARAHAGAR